MEKIINQRNKNEVEKQKKMGDKKKKKVKLREPKCNYLFSAIQFFLYSRSRQKKCLLKRKLNNNKKRK